MPTKSFNCNALITMSVYNSDVPIFQVEVTRGKMGAEDDEKKLMLTSCWNLCYTSKTFGMEVGKSCITFIQMEKMREQGTVACTSWIAQLTGANTGERVFDDLVEILDMIIATLDASYMQFDKVWDNCQKLLDANKIEPGSTFVQKTRPNTDTNCYHIPSCTCIDDQKKIFKDPAQVEEVAQQ